MSLKEIYTELESLRELQAEIEQFQQNHKASPCIFSDTMLEQLENRIEELKAMLSGVRPTGVK